MFLKLDAVHTLKTVFFLNQTYLMTNFSLDFLQRSLGHDTAASPDEGKLELSVHLQADNGTDVGCTLSVHVAITFLRTVLERRIRSQNQLFHILKQFSLSNF